MQKLHCVCREAISRRHSVSIAPCRRNYWLVTGREHQFHGDLASVAEMLPEAGLRYADPEYIAAFWTIQS